MLLNTNEIRIENCTLCNYRCDFCPHSKSFTRKKEIMSNDFYNQIINKVEKEIPGITEVTVSGFGEAFLDGKIIDKICYAKSKGFKVHVVTNGSLLTEKIIDQLITVVEDIRISLHTTIEDHYMSITGAKKGQLNHVLNAIDYISNHKLKINTQLIVTADIIEKNKNDIEKLRKDVESKIDLLEIWKPHNWVAWGQYREGPIVKQTCGRPWNSPIQLQVDGTINMCCFDYNGKLLLGDIKTQSFEEIFSGKKIKEIRRIHSMNEIANCNLICSECDQIRDTGSIVVYNNKYKEEDRIGKTSTNYRELK